MISRTGKIQYNLLFPVPNMKPMNFPFETRTKRVVSPIRTKTTTNVQKNTKNALFRGARTTLGHQAGFHDSDSRTPMSRLSKYRVYVQNLAFTSENTGKYTILGPFWAPFSRKFGKVHEGAHLGKKFAPRGAEELLNNNLGPSAGQWRRRNGYNHRGEQEVFRLRATEGGNYC